MARVDPFTKETSEGAIFARLWDSAEAGLSAVVAQHILKVGFSEQDRSRMHELAGRNQEGKLTAAESQELDNFVKVGDLLAILQSKARKRLKHSARKARRHG